MATFPSYYLQYKERKTRRKSGETMVNTELSNIIKMFNSKGRMSFLPPATSEEIDDFEQRNGVRLPAQYKEWLLFSDGGDLFLPAGVQFYGVGHRPLIDLQNPVMPVGYYIVIGALSNGDPILCEQNDDTISIYNLEWGRIEKDETFPDFISFLKELELILGEG